MSSETFYVDWASRHMLSVTESDSEITIMEWGIKKNDTIQYDTYPIELPENFLTSLEGFLQQNLIQKVRPDSLYISEEKIYYFSMGDLQYGPNGKFLYFMSRLRDNIYQCENLFVEYKKNEIIFSTVKDLNTVLDELCTSSSSTRHILDQSALKTVKATIWNQMCEKIFYIKASNNSAECLLNNKNRQSVILEEMILKNVISPQYYNKILNFVLKK